MAADVPVLPPVVAVTVVDVPDTVWVVSVIVATPLPFVVDVAAEKEPLASDLVHVTTCPLVVTGLLFASASCAVIVTPLPATGPVELELTRYFVAPPAVNVTVASPLVIALPPIVPEIVAVPAEVGEVRVAP
jgi:hypothetical protein